VDVVRVPRRTWFAATLAVTLAAAAPRQDADETLRSLARAEAGQQGRLIRIGLETGHVLRVSSERPFRILDPLRLGAAWKEQYSGEVAIVADGGPEGDVASVFRVQVAAFSTKDAADEERTRLEKAYGAPAIVHYVADRGSWRVRLGESKTREGLSGLVQRLRAAGIEGAWITEEPAEVPAGIRLRLVDASYQSQLTEADRLAVVPAPGGTVRLEGKPYRGILELRLSRFGTVRGINWVELEDYLPGVVPAELGPEIWPQLEALKAQAVAARTYAMRNLGMFGDEGYDLCATPRCQVYSGASAEHPLSDRAVAETQDEILTWQGKPISALYTATCGGHTEDAEEIFPEERAPYLRGVPCRAEGDALATLRALLTGREIAPVVTETGLDVTRDWGLLSAAGVVSPTQDPARPLEAGDLRGFTSALARLAGRPVPEGPLADVSDLAKAAAALVAETGWSERAQVLLSEEDVAGLLRGEAARPLAPPERRALAYLSLSEAIDPFADGTLGVDRRPSRARVLSALTRIGEAYEAFGLHEATVARPGDGHIDLAVGKGSLRLPLEVRPFLFTLLAGKVAPAPRLELWPGDRIRYRVGSGGAIDFLELRPPVKGVSDDRSAKVYSWEVRQSRVEIEEAIRRRLDVGTVRDLQVTRRGASGRIVELRVVGDRGSTTVRGFDVRTLLGLRESLAVIEPQRGRDGQIEAVVFAGKGWGHGVGLCQVGAYGMALRGLGYREILGHYYRGAVLQKLGPEAR